MAKSKAPALLLYTSDFLTGTMFMTDSQVGKYIRILCAMHQTGRLSNEDMLNICKTYDKKIYEKFDVDSDGLYFNSRLEKEIKKRNDYSESRRQNRLKIKEDMINISDSYEKHMENENVNEDLNEKESVNEIEVWPTFDDFWNTYDKKSGNKIDSLKKWDKIDQKLKEAIMTHVFAYVRSTPDPQFRKNPETYLNQKHYHNEILTNQENGRGHNIETAKKYATIISGQRD